MSWTITAAERTYLRELARKQAEYAALPIMEERKRLWRDLNDGRPARPPIVIETWTFDRDFMPDSVFRCESAAARSLEAPLLRVIREHELIDDDKIVPDHFRVSWHVEIDELGIAIPTERVKDAQGVETGYRFLHPIHDLKTDLALLKPAVCRVDREKTFAYKEFVESVFGDILPVRLTGWMYGCRSLTQRVVQLMGMEAFFLAMYDEPEALHRLMEFLRDNALRVMRWAEAEGLLTLNNGPADNIASSILITDKLPAPDYDGKRVRLCDMWGSAESQETVGVAPAMFHEFCFPYYRDVCAPMGLLYWGCCEPAHPFWDDLRRLPHLKKVSISRWCDQRFMGEALQGTGIVFSRKPDPNYLGVEGGWSDEAWTAHIRETLAAARGVALEFIVRDVYTLHGDLARPRRAVALARRASERFFQA
ncbi:MAG: hypothetical protein N3A66_01710 [Planctomycetota bacterium]|nr:hypothetical protein [Planctomycetota bacterium]